MALVQLDLTAISEMVRKEIRGYLYAPLNPLETPLGAGVAGEPWDC